MLSKEQIYLMRESKLNTSQMLLFITIVSSIFLTLLMDFSNIVIQIIGVVTILLQFMFIYGAYTLNKKQDKLLKEMQEVD